MPRKAMAHNKLNNRLGLTPYVISSKILVAFCCDLFEFFGGNNISVLDYIYSVVPKPKNPIKSTVQDLKAVDNLSHREDSGLVLSRACAWQLVLGLEISFCMALYRKQRRMRCPKARVY